ncbi:hypothetical protein [Methylobacter sp. S3L5C]|uniref:hypothetical protein n=1 Tax=Methylobacter sp. S3L5C TaxID=2839024 RepID=UPI001FAD601C|nr:hypothetical protein [Methylobacter sp. S3L5C]UOA07590.1 hypothetical protein KKZ03_15150 [Methylobacter sp. S3L5C]
MKIRYLLASAFVLVAATGCGDSNDSTKLLWPRSAIDISSTKIKDYKVTASSQKDELGPQGLFASVQPGWHSVSPPHYPESVTLLHGDQKKMIQILLRHVLFRSQSA